MIEEYFNLTKAPFRLSIDSLFYYDSDRHRKALSYLQYGIQQAEGIVVVTGEAGVGKSMLIEQFLLELDDSDVLTAVVSPGPVSQSEILEHVMSAFRINAREQGKVAQINALRDFFVDQREEGRQVLLIVDEAQNLSASAVEEIRQLTNHTYGSMALLQVFLIGQPSLRETLTLPEMEQLRQRVIASCELRPLNASEVADYINHRMGVSGCPDTSQVFSEVAYDGIFRLTGGLPRKINTLCSRLLLQAALDEKERVDSETVEKVIADLNMESLEHQDTDLAKENLPVLDAGRQTDLRDNVVHLKQEIVEPKAATGPAVQEQGDAIEGQEKQPVENEAGTDLPQPASLEDLAQQIVQFSAVGQSIPETKPEWRVPEDMDQFKNDMHQLITDVQEELGVAGQRMTSLKTSIEHLDEYRKGRNKIIERHLQEIDQALTEIIDGE